MVADVSALGEQVVRIRVGRAAPGQRAAHRLGVNPKRVSNIDLHHPLVVKFFYHPVVLLSEHAFFRFPSRNG